MIKNLECVLKSLKDALEEKGVICAKSEVKLKEMVL